MSWNAQELFLLNAAVELEIAARRWTPVWVVCAGERVFVRTWHRRETGWYGQALRSGRGRIRVPGLEADVVIVDVGDEGFEAVDAAYREKYGVGAASMVTAEARASTLRLDRR